MPEILLVAQLMAFMPGEDFQDWVDRPQKSPFLKGTFFLCRVRLRDSETYS